MVSRILSSGVVICLCVALSTPAHAKPAKKQAPPPKKPPAGQNLSSAEAAAQRIREVAGPEDGEIIVEIDVNGDGKPDVWNHYIVRSDSSRQLTRRDADLDGDGRPDMVSEFDETGALKLERMDGDFDGTFEWVDHYQDGYRILTEVDTNHNGTPDLFYYYGKNGDQTYLERREADANHDGRIDLWERFGADGKLIRAARDTDGDGKPDTRIE